MKRIPRIKFPQRHPKPAGSGPPPAVDQKPLARSVAQVQTPSTSSEAPKYRFRSDVPAPPSNIAIGGKASLLPKRTPLSENEIEAILMGGCL